MVRAAWLATRALGSATAAVRLATASGEAMHAERLARAAMMTTTMESRPQAAHVCGVIIGAMVHSVVLTASSAGGSVASASLTALGSAFGAISCARASVGSSGPYATGDVSVGSTGNPRGDGDGKGGDRVHRWKALHPAAAVSCMMREPRIRYHT